VRDANCRRTHPRSDSSRHHEAQPSPHPLRNRRGWPRPAVGLQYSFGNLEEGIFPTRAITPGLAICFYPDPDGVLESGFCGEPVDDDDEVCVLTEDDFDDGTTGIDIDIDNCNDNEIDLDNDNTNNNGNFNGNFNNNANANDNDNDNENTNDQDQTNDQGQDNTNDQTNNIDSSPEVNIDFD
jgi:hypothetical protein